MPTRVIIAPSFEIALTAGKVAATVEAEYGVRVVRGEKSTLAHHSEEFAGNPAPCSVDTIVLKEDDIILVSHLDADTVGGCLSLMGKKPISENFWNAVAFVDINGPHNMHRLLYLQQDMLNAYWAWNYSQPRVRYEGLTDVTNLVLDNIEIIEKIISYDPEIIQAGITWAEEIESAVESCLVFESDKIRTFKTDSVFCSASYYSKQYQTAVPATVVMNRKMRAITIAFADGGKKHSAKKLVQSLWGDKAGGHDGIAGSPRNIELTDDELENYFVQAVDAVKAL